MRWMLMLVVVFLHINTIQSESSSSQASYSDVRCKCVCPKGNSTERNVFVATVEPEQCNCQHIVKREENFCLRCQCMYEARNTILIKVVIIFIIVLLVCLTVYAIYLLVDSKMSPVEISVSSDEMQERLTARTRGARNFSVRAFDRRHARWKQQVAAQRRHIYDTRTMLS
ncbi:putative protein 2 [Actinia tenebrosa]|uniref:Transmembrane protein 9-like n=1 Tax=Actinia tenebrosa TaxID=6105 RepID=A0A6P8IEB5_ACTTE|nr:putative protein 2 [Actinia tenebrosa]